jgi:hypothetical protein
LSTFESSRFKSCDETFQVPVATMLRDEGVIPMAVKLNPRQHRIQRLAGPQGCAGFGLVGLVVAADVHGVALDGKEFGYDFLFASG